MRKTYRRVLGGSILLVVTAFLWDRDFTHGSSPEVHSRATEADASDFPEPACDPSDNWKRAPQTLAHEQAVQEELATSSTDWAGVYYYGDGLGMNVWLSLAPDAGFAFTWDGCMGLYDQDWGPVDAENGEIRLTCTREQDEDPGIAQRLVPIHWGARVYLIPPEQMIAFANDVRSGVEPRSEIHGNHLLRGEDWSSPTTGRPELPEIYRYAWEAAPISGQVLEVLDVAPHPYQDDCSLARLRMNIGRREGAWTGLVLWCTDPDDVSMLGSVLTVESESSIVSVMVCDDDPTPEPGWWFARRARW